MRSIWKDTLTAAFLGLILPGVLLNGAALYLDTMPIDPVQEETKPQQETLQLYLRNSDGGVQMQDMDNYLTGVVMAEMTAG